MVGPGRRRHRHRHGRRDAPGSTRDWRAAGAPGARRRRALHVEHPSGSYPRLPRPHGTSAMTDTIARVVMFHTEYAQPGGEDVSVQMDGALLRGQGIEVLPFRASNRAVLEGPKRVAAATLMRSHFNRAVYEEVRAFCRRHKPDVAHVQNFWFALSPSVHAACHAEGVATVQTLRNYRLLCVNAMLMRNGGPCEDCVGRAPLPGIVHACYQHSRLSSALVAHMILHNRRRGTWQHDVDMF